MKPRYIAIASGKGGVGKSTFTVNLATILSKTHSVLAIDCDLGLANLDILLGVQSVATLQDILYANRSAKEACITINNNFSLLPSASGTIESIGMDIVAIEILFKKIEPICAEYEYVLLDLGAGATRTTTCFIEYAQECIIIVTPDPTSLLDAYALIKILIKQNSVSTISIVISMAENEEEAKVLFARMQDIVSLYSDCKTELVLLGWVVYDECIFRCGYEQLLFSNVYSTSAPTKCMYNIVEQLQNY